MRRQRHATDCVFWQARHAPAGDPANVVVNDLDVRTMAHDRQIRKPFLEGLRNRAGKVNCSQFSTGHGVKPRRNPGISANRVPTDWNNACR